MYSLSMILYLIKSVTFVQGQSIFWNQIAWIENHLTTCYNSINCLNNHKLNILCHVTWREVEFIAHHRQNGYKTSGEMTNTKYSIINYNGDQNSPIRPFDVNTIISNTFIDLFKSHLKKARALVRFTELKRTHTYKHLPYTNS